MDSITKLRDTPIKKIIKKRFKSVKPDTPVTKVAKLLSSIELSMLPVIDDNGVYVGEVVESDLLKIIVDPRDLPFNTIMSEPLLGMSFCPETAREIMRRHPSFLKADMSIRKAAKKMFLSHAGVLPVKDKGKMVGLVFVDDLVKLLSQVK
jgi:predicted transcriptional regulator